MVNNIKKLLAMLFVALVMYASVIRVRRITISYYNGTTIDIILNALWLAGDFCVGVLVYKLAFGKKKITKPRLLNIIGLQSLILAALYILIFVLTIGPQMLVSGYYVPRDIIQIAAFFWETFALALIIGGTCLGISYAKHKMNKTVEETKHLP